MNSHIWKNGRKAPWNIDKYIHMNSTILHNVYYVEFSVARATQSLVVSLFFEFIEMQGVVKLFIKWNNSFTGIDIFGFNDKLCSSS